MKKTLFLLLILLLGIFSGCKTGPADATGGATTVPLTTTAPETTQTMPTTTPDGTIIPTEETTVPPVYEERDLRMAMSRYARDPDEITVFCGGSAFRDEEEIEKFELTDGYLYCYQKLLDQCFLIADQTGTIFESTKDYIYYVLPEEPTRLYRSDYFGNEILLYESPSGQITNFCYYGTDPNGKVLLTVDNTYAVLFDIPTGQAEELMEWENVRLYCFNYFDREEAFALYWYCSSPDQEWRLNPFTNEVEMMWDWTREH